MRFDYSWHESDGSTLGGRCRDGSFSSVPDAADGAEATVPTCAVLHVFVTLRPGSARLHAGRPVLQSLHRFGRRLSPAVLIQAPGPSVSCGRMTRQRLIEILGGWSL